MRDFREDIIQKLVEEYENYLRHNTLDELRIIEKSNVFTLREAKKEIHK